MRTLRYVGGLAAVEVDRLPVRRGETVQVDDDLAEHMLTWDGWEAVPAEPGVKADTSARQEDSGDGE